MGINPRQFKLPIATPLQAAKRVVAVAGSYGAFLNVRVPTVGLHAKGAFIYGKGGVGRYAPHADKAALRKAKELYAQTLPLIPAPLAGPLVLHVDFVLEPPANCDPFPQDALPYTGKPDRSNLLKVFEDALRRAGWMHDDSLIVRHAGGKWVSFDHSLQGVWFVLKTIVAGNIAGAFEPPPAAMGDFTPFKAFRFREGGDVAPHR